MYIGARMLGLDRWQAGAAALFSPMLVNNTGYGFEWQSFIWLGGGSGRCCGRCGSCRSLGSLLAGGLQGRTLALTAFVVGLTCAFHFITGYLVLLSLGVFVIVRPPKFAEAFRAARASSASAGVLIFAFVFVPDDRPTSTT